MATDYQKKYIERLYTELGQELEVDVDSLTKAEAHEYIQELLNIMSEV